MRRVAPLLLLLLPGCAVLEAILLGGTTGAAVTKTPEGALAGAAAGLVVGSWDWLVSTVKGWFGLGHGLVPAPPAPSYAVYIWVGLGLTAYLLYKLIRDHDFRKHLVGLTARTIIPTARRKPHDP